ncbi:HEM4 [Candida pseudojiufengensis]|uniref:HEM4 n=1 Tax=Candida pseudojiufengensis TaxID=497109 RepID=UPI0022257B23|nr:HEM4 [Candida pseudojiufengensis]KAI5966914.1 HEM4 [Candida pseudojiufengensis]
MKKKVILLKNPSAPKDPYNDQFESKTSYKPNFIPLLTHTHSPNKQTTQNFLISTFLEFSIFIITSQRAVEMLGECISDLKPNIKSKIFEKIGYTVGPATFKMLKDIGFQDVRGGIEAGNGLKLSEIIINEVSTTSKILFLTGEIRKDIIPKQLTQASFKNFKEYAMYKTEERNDIVINFENQIFESFGWIIFFSPQGTKDIIEYLKGSKSDILKNWKLASIGPTTEEYLINEHGLIPQVVAKKPDASNLIDGILMYDEENSQ